jgi:hypothetical protein
MMFDPSKALLMQRCMEQLTKTISLEQRIKILKVLASTADHLAFELELYSDVE